VASALALTHLGRPLSANAPSSAIEMTPELA
jgi:hypothetical protein